MIKTQGFLHVTISVTDVERATAFYQNLLGCELVRQNTKKTMSFMKTGEDFFVLTKMPNHVKPNLPGPLDLETTLFHHAMIVEPDEWDRAIEYFEAEGIEYYICTGDGHTTFPGRRHAYIQDPDGNCIEIVTTSSLDAVGVGVPGRGPPPKP
ncbi:MAG: VOC family protein [Alphaproteobacteria bacterium]|nr:VOC family protein [Alphaproteobacteria bacterium]MCZ6813994.1 VOC family protein [Alphaproteobacteria bacterium]MCZ6847237.1 VOC family protein [Alphaproteobacteria bacterium]